MSVAHDTIDLTKKEDKMNEYGQPGFDPSLLVEPQPESTHPVLAKLYEQIANLEKKVADLTESESKQRSLSYDYSSAFANYKFKLENVLRTTAQDDEDTVETCVAIAEAMDIELINTKDFEINVTFSITVTAPFGEEIELSEYDISTTLDDIGGLDFELNDVGVNYINED